MKCSRFLVSWQMLSVQQSNCKSDEIIFSYGWFDAPSACRKPFFAICFSVVKSRGYHPHGLHTASKSEYASTPVVLAVAALQKWLVPPFALLLTKTLALITRDIMTEVYPTAVYAAHDVVLYPPRCLRFTFLSNRPAGLQEEDLNCCWITRQLFPIQ